MSRLIKSYKFHYLHPHHIYQLEVIFLFVFGFFIFIPFFLFSEEFNWDMSRAQWYFVIPWILFYSLYSLYQRSKIKKAEKVKPLKRPIIHWVLLGITLVTYHTKPIDYENLYGLDLAFIVFSLFLADSYWSFKKTNL